MSEPTEPPAAPEPPPDRARFVRMLFPRDASPAQITEAINKAHAEARSRNGESGKQPKAE